MNYLNKITAMKNKISKDKLITFLIFPCSIIYMELIFKYLTTPVFFNVGLIFMPLYSLVGGSVLNILCTSFSERANKIIAKISLFVLAFIFSLQTVYHWCFDKYMILYSVGVGGADQIIEDGILENTVKAIKACALPVILFFIPAVLGCIFIGKKGIIFPKIGLKPRLISLASSIGFNLLVTLLALLIPLSNEIYFQAFDMNLTASYFGLLNSEVKDIMYNLLGVDHHSEIDENVSSEIPVNVSSKKEQEEYEPWQMNIDFDALMSKETDEEVQNLHKYFASRTPTLKNEYTGIFEDYNLIYITAEGFSQYAIDEKLTPTLYKMYNKGFQFNNFYTPIWGVSTFDGEYVNCTGLIPKSGVWSLYRAGQQKNNMRFTMGRQFLNSGVDRVYAYHNHTYTYYHRDISHPNMGYKYKGVGNGLEKKITKCWPESDLEMIEATADEYISSEKRFHAYYMTVSGHMDYSFSLNSMSAKNRTLVEDLPYSDTAKAYIACNIELDRAMEKLLIKLEAAGVADKTLIVIAPDHYPYGLEDKNDKDPYRYISELAGHTVDTDFEIYKSVLLMYSPSMKKSVSVDKYCSNLDILPTISNLLNMEYDSRLIMGRDILSSSSQLVVFSDRSFINEKGMYNAIDRTFKDFEGNIIEDDENLETYKSEVNNMFLASAGILDNDYYGIVFGTKKENFKNK